MSCLKGDKYCQTRRKRDDVADLPPPLVTVCVGDRDGERWSRVVLLEPFAPSNEML